MSKERVSSVPQWTRGGKRSRDFLGFLRKLGEGLVKNRIFQTLRYGFLRMKSERTWIRSQRRYPIYITPLGSEDYCCVLFKAFWYGTVHRESLFKCSVFRLRNRREFSLCSSLNLRHVLLLQKYDAPHVLLDPWLHPLKAPTAFR